jgi:hypothetical protein
LKREFVFYQSSFFTCPQLHSHCPFVATEVAAPILSAAAPSNRLQECGLGSPPSVPGKPSTSARAGAPMASRPACLANRRAAGNRASSAVPTTFRLSLHHCQAALNG